MNWQDKIKEYCYRYNIPLEYLSDTLYEPKVVPMIRGKAFEFNMKLALEDILSAQTWEVEKIPMNAQQGLHDIDVIVRHKETQKEARLECKLAAKGGFRLLQTGDSIIRVKCMRSRTLGESMVRHLAPKFGVSEKQLTVHNDQYRPEDFDFVVTSIGNAFYETNSSGFFDWAPSQEGIAFLETLRRAKTENNLKDFAFNRMYIAPANALSIKGKNGVQCTRKKCKAKTTCCFIPNYPIIRFKQGKRLPEAPWVAAENSENFFKDFLGI